MRAFTLPTALFLFASLLSFALGAAEGEIERDGPDRNAVDPSRSAERRQLVEGTIIARGVTDRAVIDAMLRVPRHLFVPAEQVDAAYQDRPLPIGYGQTISQPYIVAYMTEALSLHPGQRVLEIGTGSGYQAAILAELTDSVFSIEVVGALQEQAQLRLARLGYRSVKLRLGDGYYGWEEQAPFDRMIVTAAADHVPPPLIAQLAPGGRMVIPVGPPFGIQTLLLIEKRSDGAIVRSPLLDVRFVPFTRGFR
ncbi:protein-L-isoaspartate(D-aspartate) O-methyltransferase [Salinispira pacifica]